MKNRYSSELNSWHGMRQQMTPDDIDFIKNLLRQGSIKWKGRAECLRLARRLVRVRRGKQGQTISKYHWQCAACKQWERNEKSMEVDHIIEIGPFTGDWNVFMEKIFPRPIEKFLQALCISCHMKKTMAYNSARTRWQRKNK